MDLQTPLLLEDPFYAIDSRDYQVVQPKLSVFKRREQKIISLEKIRDHVQYESNNGGPFYGLFCWTQFHPEADPVSFVAHLRNKERENQRKWKEKKFRNMLEDLLDDDKNISY
jgi:hypothetical protein